ncbi:Uncharacterized protein YR821_2112 [Yersinia ruckeri]|uniref:Uncharacterized protein n=1 Tax=Yersinia ruckeri TaxID=29486 RepID=A0A0A8VDR1_YERRU|nr:Uncharacterized protein YR821_2112 [Yersinia ruckeri]CEK27922.1 hypothetical protein CSF007_10860 [Yersinia ruckeri]
MGGWWAKTKKGHAIAQPHNYLPAVLSTADDGGILISDAG